MADMMQYVNNLEERLNDSSAANERRDEHDYRWPRNPDLKELKNIDDKSHLKEFFEKRPHYIPLCLVGVCRSNLVFVKERSELNTPLQQTNEQTLTTSK